MKIVNVVIMVEKNLSETGGVVVVLPKKMSRDAFEAKYQEALQKSRNGGASSGKTKGALRFSGRLRGTVSFVRFDTPDGDYNYRFVAADAPETSVRETQISVGGTGYTDAMTGLPVETTSVVTHYIHGGRISIHTARGLETLSSKFTIDEQSCEVFDHVTICSGSAEDIEKALTTIKALDGQN